MDELVSICRVDLSARVEILKNNSSIKSIEGRMQEYKGVGVHNLLTKGGFCVGGGGGEKRYSRDQGCGLWNLNPELESWFTRSLT